MVEDFENKFKARYIAEKIAHDITFNRMLRALWVYYQAHGTIVVANTHDKKLQQWVGTQRSTRKKGSLTKEKISCLDRLGFDWNPQIASWEERFLELQMYKNKYGHADIPCRNQEYPRLAQWVREQRLYHKQGTLAAAQVKKLKTVSFAWEFEDNQYKHLNQEQRNNHHTNQQTIGK